MIGRCGLSGGDGGGGVREGGDVVPMAEEWDNAVPGPDDSVEAVGVVAAWTWQRRRWHRMFWQLDGVPIEILRLGFKDGATGCFIVAPQ
jgi:hypothetical protein